MEATDRANRQFMRQRGAGLRNNNNNVDFGLEFGAHGSREDRQLMRQRGAANRKIGNIDFGFSFLTPSRSRRSSRTPQTGRQSVERSSKTPVSGRIQRTPIAQSQQAASNNLSKSQTRARVTSRTPRPIVQAARSNSSKKRKLIHETGNQNPPQTSVDIPVVSSLNEASSSTLETQKQDLYSEGSHVQNPASDNDEENLEQQQQIRSPLSFPENDKENADMFEIGSRQLKSTTKQRKHSVGLGELRNGVSLSRASSPDGAIVSSIENAHLSRQMQPSDNTGRTDVEPELNGGADVDSDERSTPDAEPQFEEHSVESAKQPRKKRKRKSVILGPKKRRSLEDKRQSLLSEVARAPATEIVGLDESPSDEETREEEESTLEENADVETPNGPLPLWKQLVARRAQGRQSRLSIPTSPVQYTLDDQEDDASYVDEDDDDKIHEELVTPANKKRKLAARAKTKEKRPKNRTTTEPRSKAKLGTFPILTYRITNTEALPTIIEEDEDEHISDGDAKPLPPAFSNRTQPNAVDILAQVCRETIQAAVANLGANERGGRAETKTKRAALEAFSEALDQRLFEMSEAVEHRLNLEARVRKSKREKAELQTRWIEVRRQRDELALRTDEIRRQNWENEENGKRQWEISELANSTELESDRTEAEDEESLEMMLKQLGKSASQAGGPSSILNRVRAFNSRLERIATALER